MSVESDGEQVRHIIHDVVNFLTAAMVGYLLFETTADPFWAVTAAVMAVLGIAMVFIRVVSPSSDSTEVAN